jgi:Zn-dependent protease
MSRQANVPDSSKHTSRQASVPDTMGLVGSRSTVRLGRILGIRIGATPSWFFVLFLLIYLLTGYFADVLDGSDTQAFLCAVAGALLFEASLVVHELGHAVVARRYDVPITGIDLWFFGGLAKLGRDPDTPGREFKVAAAGPAVTLAVIAGCLVAGLLASASGSVLDIATLQVTEVTPALALLGFLGGINALLLVFNLIPAYPLDGGRIAMAVAWKATGERTRGLRFSARLGQGFAYVLIAVGIALAIRGTLFDGLWFMVLGWFMSQSARAAVVSSDFQERISGVTVADLMDPAPVAMPADVPALEAQDAWFGRYGSAFFPVVDDGRRLVGLLRADRVDGALSDGQPTLSAGELADADASFRVAPDAALGDLLASVPLRALGALAVVDLDGHLCGMVTVEQVRRALAASA